MFEVCFVIVRMGTVLTNCRMDGIEHAKVGLVLMDKHPVEVLRGMLFMP